jgi:hypothetical protein
MAKLSVLYSQHGISLSNKKSKQPYTMLLPTSAFPSGT